MRVVRCVLSGSYRRDLQGLQQEYRELAAAGCQILSPHRLELANAGDAFVKDVAEIGLSVQEIENHHLLAIRQSDFVWLFCPNGYIGLAATMELGYALALGIPLFSKTLPQEPVLQPFVTVVPSVFMALDTLPTTSLQKTTP